MICEREINVKIVYVCVCFSSNLGRAWREPSRLQSRSARALLHNVYVWIFTRRVAFLSN